MVCKCISGVLYMTNHYIFQMSYMCLPGDGLMFADALSPRFCTLLRLITLSTSFSRYRLNFRSFVFGQSPYWTHMSTCQNIRFYPDSMSAGYICAMYVPHLSLVTLQNRVWSPLSTDQSNSYDYDKTLVKSSLTRKHLT